MLKSSKKILFIGHNATLSGAPLVLLNLAKWIKNHHPEIVIDILLMKNGEYIDEYSKTFSQVYFANDTVDDTFITTTKNKIKRKLGLSHKDVLLKKIYANNYDIIYCNTVFTLNWGVVINKSLSASKLVLHVHELNGAIRILAPNFAEQAKFVDQFICASQAVIDNISNTYQVPEEKLHLVYEFIEIVGQNILPPKNTSSNFIVGSSGFADWRKGYDLFLLTAYQFKKKFPEVNIKFQWVGVVPKESEIVISEDIKKLKIGDFVEFTGKTSAPLQEFNNFDVFLLLSREDPFPLVCLEAGSLGKAVICFEKAGGIGELIADGGGTIVPYLDIEEVVNAIYLYYSNRAKLINDGEVLSRKVTQYTTALLAPQIYQVLSK